MNNETMNLKTSSKDASQGGTTSENHKFDLPQKVVLILCGLVASGKSTFAEALQHHFPQFRRCNQDELGDRCQVERLARESLDQGFSVCIDRTNFNQSQRSFWIQIAREFPGTLIWVIVFDTPYETCKTRLHQRTSHPTIKNPVQGLSILQRFAANYQPPQPHEGYDRIIHLEPTHYTSPNYTSSDIFAILSWVRDSPPVVSNTSPAFRSRRGRTIPPFRGDFHGTYRTQYRGDSKMRPYGNRGRGINISSGSSQQSRFRGRLENPRGEHIHNEIGQGETSACRREEANVSTSSEIAPGGNSTCNNPFTAE